jgi:Flp pilus assembly protein TadD
LQLARAGDLKSAEVELRRAVDLAPDNPDYLADLGGVLGMQQKLAEAGAYFEKALRIDPGNLTVRRDLATNQWQMGRLHEAKANLERIQKSKPGDPPTILLLGMVTENLGDYAKAAAWLGSVPDLVKQRPESIAALARSYYQIGQKERAKETLVHLLNPPASPQGVFLGGQIASQAGDDETALSLFESIRPTYPDQERLNYNRALAWYRGNHFAEAENLLQDLISAGPPTSQAYSLLAWSYYKQGKIKETVRAMDMAIDLDPAKESNYLDLGKMLTDRRALAVARAVATQAVEKIPNSFRAYMMKGFVEAKQGDFAQAVASYRRAAELKPDSPEANFKLARMQWVAGMDKEAEATFEQGLQRFPQDALTYQEYALMLLKRAESGDKAAEARAVSLLMRAITLDKSLSEPHYQLGKLWLDKGKTTEALQELQTAAKLNPEEAKTHFALSRAYRHQGHSDQAETERALFESLNAEAREFK